MKSDRDECFVFCGVFRENIHEISTKYEKCIASHRKYKENYFEKLEKLGEI